MKHGFVGCSFDGRATDAPRKEFPHFVAVTVGTHRSEFAYDGQQRRVRIVEKENSVVQSDAKVVWCEAEICEERAADGVTVTRRAFALGEQAPICTGVGAVAARTRSRTRPWCHSCRLPIATLPATV
jgi:hypothetical protein